VDSLKRLNVAAVKNFDYGKALNKYVLREYKKNISKVQLMVGKNIHLRNFKMLLNGRVDLILVDLQLGKYTIKKM